MIEWVTNFVTEWHQKADSYLQGNLRPREDWIDHILAPRWDDKRHLSIVSIVKLFENMD